MAFLIPYLIPQVRSCRLRYFLASLKIFLVDVCGPTAASTLFATSSAISGATPDLSSDWRSLPRLNSSTAPDALTTSCIIREHPSPTSAGDNWKGPPRQSPQKAHA